MVGISNTLNQKILWPLLIALGLQFSHVGAAASETLSSSDGLNCELLLRHGPTKLDFNSFFTNLKSADFDGYTVERIKKSLSLRLQYKRKILSTNKEVIRYNVIQFLKEMDQGGLGLERKKIVDEHLEAHGAQLSDDPDVDNLKVASRRNLVHLLTLLPATEKLEPELNQIVDAVNQIYLQFTHNTNLDPSESSALPLLASRYLEKLSGVKGMHSRNPFNWNILKSDGSVFYSMDIYVSERGRSLRLGEESEYGFSALRLRNSYARANGMISAFAMRPNDLPSKINGQYLGGIDEVVPQLHHLDFTVDDFELLVKKLLLSYFSELHKTNPLEFGREARSFLKSDVSINDFVKDAIKKHLDFNAPSFFELKIPVLVPNDQNHQL